MPQVQGDFSSLKSNGISSGVGSGKHLAYTCSLLATISHNTGGFFFFLRSFDVSGSNLLSSGSQEVQEVS